ncbi:MAG: EI24 domain-containing protein [Pseudolysinimonas sp.]
MARPVAGAHTVASEFFGGVATLFRGFGWWRRRPDLMLLGLVPAAIVFAGLVGVLIVIIAGAEGFVGWLTPFADAWNPALAQLFRVALALTLLAGFIVIAVLAFTGLTLIVGDWFYERIWLAVEAQLGGFARGSEPGFWRGVADALRLVPPAVLSALVVMLVGFIPVVGTVAGAVLGAVLAGRILARELTARPMEARGLSHDQRRVLFRGHRARTLGFGVAVQLCFLVPGGAILVMAPAVAGATQLTRDLLETPAADRR